MQVGEKGRELLFGKRLRAVASEPTRQQRALALRRASSSRDGIVRRHHRHHLLELGAVHSIVAVAVHQPKRHIKISERKEENKQTHTQTRTYFWGMDRSEVKKTYSANEMSPSPLGSATAITRAKEAGSVNFFSSLSKREQSVQHSNATDANKRLLPVAGRSVWGDGPDKVFGRHKGLIAVLDRSKVLKHLAKENEVGKKEKKKKRKKKKKGSTVETALPFRASSSRGCDSHSCPSLSASSGSPFRAPRKPLAL